MQSLRRFGDWLREGAKFKWGELTKQGIATIKATSELGKTWTENAPKVAQLERFDQLDSFFKAFESPVGKLAVSGLPFVSVGIDLLRLYWDVTKTEPTLESSVALAAQMAYLESLGAVLARSPVETRAKLEKVRLADVFERQLKKSEDVSLNKARAKRSLTQLRKSELVEAFDEALDELLAGAGLADWERRVFVDQVAWGAPKFFHGVVAELRGEVEPLDAFLRSDGLRIQERFDSIEDYLREKIEPLPLEKVFDEERVTFNDLYVPLMVQPLDVSGKETNESTVGIHQWAEKLLEQSEPRKVGFIEGEAGRGKSVFCRMFAAMVRTELFHSFIPILIRLRHVRELESNLSQTLGTHLQDLDFVQSDRGWLTDENTRFLLIFDGFDELLLQGRDSGGLRELVQQIGDFQKNSHHQCLVTGRPLALQGVERTLSQTQNLERVRLEPMGDERRGEWLSNWSKLFEAEEAKALRSFLTACPEDIGEGLAREPLLLYLLGRLHREGHLKAEMFAGVEGIQAKVRVYDESVRWVLERQRQALNARISGLETEDLRQVLQAAALCVVQSGNETAKLTMLKHRFTDSANPVAKLLKQTTSETGKTEDKALNNLLTAFYLRPGEGDRRGSVEFAHKSFGEFLFAERLKCAFEDWVELDRRKRFRLNDVEVARQIYDLLGYGTLTPEIFEYLKELFSSGAELEDVVRLFQRLHQFYDGWSEGEFIDKAPGENLPQGKMMQLKSEEIETGLRQVDIHAGLNIMILLFELSRYGQQLDKRQSRLRLRFHPCEKLAVGIDNLPQKHSNKLLRLAGYSQIIRLDHFLLTVGHYLRFADLGGVNLDRADLRGVDLRNVDLSDASLSNTDLSNVDLSNAKLMRADLSNANLSSAKLMDADLNSADLRNVDLSDANLLDANLSSAALSEANLLYANLRSVNLNDADLSYADLRNTNLSSASLCGANLSKVYLSDADLSYANFSAANLSAADISASNLSAANLSDANLSNAYLVGTSLSYANLSNANLHFVDLSDVYFRNTDLASADLSSVDLEGIDFDDDTDWNGVKGLDTAKNVPTVLKQQLSSDAY